MLLKTTARPIVKALFELSVEAKQVSAWAAILADLKTVIQLDFLKPFLIERRIEPAHWESFFLAIKLGHLQDLSSEPVLVNLLWQLAEKQNLGLLPTIADEFEIMRRQYENEQLFTVLYSSPLDDAFQTSIQDYLAERFQCKPILAFKEDPQLQGGVKIQGEGWTLDYSIQGSLAQLREQLAKTAQ